MQKRFRFWILFKECFENMKKSTKNPPWFAPKLPKMRKKLKKWLLFSCVFIFAGTVDDSVFCNHFSWMSKLVIFGYPIATPFRKSRSDIWNVVQFFFYSWQCVPYPPFQSRGRNMRIFLINKRIYAIKVQVLCFFQRMYLND